MDIKQVMRIKLAYTIATFIQNSLDISPDRTGYTALVETYNKAMKEVKWLEHNEGNLKKYRADKEKYRKLLSPFLDGPESERIDALRTRRSIGVDGNNETIDHVAHCLYAATINEKSCSEGVSDATLKLFQYSNELDKQYKEYISKYNFVDKPVKNVAKSTLLVYINNIRG